MLKNLFRHTFFYGLASVLPRLLTFLLTPFYVELLPNASDFGRYSSLMVFMILGNVVLSYGMETAFFRFVNKHPKKLQVQQTALASILISTILFAGLSIPFSGTLALWANYNPIYIKYAVAILCLDALTIVPFAYLRYLEKSKKFSFIKIGNVCLNILCNILFLLVFQNTFDFLKDKVHAIFLSLLIPSFTTVLILIPIYIKIGIKLNKILWKQMLNYSYPVLFSGIAFAVNEGFDKLFLRYSLPNNIADTQVGIYAACYKLGMFMTLFITSFKLGVEPFFFQQAKALNAKNQYAIIMYYFVLFGSIILLSVTVFIDILKYIIVPNEIYWDGLWVVPIILLANLCLGIYHNLSVWYKVTDKIYFGAIFSLVGVTITFIGNLVLIPIIGFKGSAITTLLSYGVMMIISYWVGKQYYPIPYAIKKIISILILSSGMAFVSFYFFNGNTYLSSSFFILFLVIIFFIEKSNIKLLIKKK